jgi:hypothetical protein
MSNHDPDPDPPVDIIRNIANERQLRADEHAAVRASNAYKGAMRQIDRYILDYGLGINAIEFMATRNPPYFDQLISLRIKPHFVQSMIAASHNTVHLSVWSLYIAG